MKPTVAAFLNFFVTLSLFPGTISSIKSIPSNAGGPLFHLGDWLPIVLITTFNAADCAGRGVLHIEWFGLSMLLLFKRDSVRAAPDRDDAASSRTTVLLVVPFAVANSKVPVRTMRMRTGRLFLLRRQ